MTIKKERLKEFLRLGVYVSITMPLFLSCVYLLLTWNLPKINSITDYRPPIITRVLCEDGSLCGEFFLEKRKPITFSDIPKFIRDAFVASEDERFYEHKGIDFVSILRAFLKNIAAGEIVQGGSTITQQVTKSLLLTPEKKISRKIKEAILAHRIERKLKKDEILDIYLNQIYLGHGAYGIETAAELYFGKRARDLTEAEGAVLAGLPKAPARYSPITHPRRAKTRQRYVLDRMIASGYLTREEADKIYAQPVRVKTNREESVNSRAPYFNEEVRRYLEGKYGADMIYNEGLTVYTSLDPDMNSAAHSAVRDGLRALDKRQGYRGPLGHLDPKEVQAFLAKIQKEEIDRGPEEFVITKDLVSHSPPAPASEAEEEESPQTAEKRPAGPAAPEIGKEYTGVVSSVDRKKKEAEVSVGRFRGILPREEMSWARKPDPDIDFAEAAVRDPSAVLSAGDVIRVKVLRAPAHGGAGDKGAYVLSLEQEPIAQGALIAMDVDTGYIMAMVGGYDYQKSQFNRATQAKRQAGSAFKPIYYSAALDKGYTPASVILDAPVVYENLDSEDDKAWKPRNYDEQFKGPVTMREALAMSKNNPSIRLMENIGTEYAIRYAERLGISSPLANDLTIALGSSSVTLLELVNAYNVFASGGTLRDPVFVKKIVDRDGNVLENNPPRVKALPAEIDQTMPGMPQTDSTWKPGQVISEQTAFIMTDLLRNVVEHGTGWRIKALGRPAAGKTGTSEEYRDAWFIGYTPNLTTGVWVGFDTEAALGKGESGARAASPLWLEFMKQAVRKRPMRDFSIPLGIVFAKIDPQTGLLASPDTKDPLFEAFREGTAPSDHSSEGSPSPDENFFKFDRGL